nr:MAG TPA: viral infectifity protein [Caudoviricetes sp.]
MNIRSVYFPCFTSSKLRKFKFLSKLLLCYMLFCLSLRFSSTFNLTKELMTLIVILLLHLSLRTFHMCHNYISLRLFPLLHQNF